MTRGTPFEVIVYGDDQPAALPRMGGSAGWGETDQQCYVPVLATNAIRTLTAVQRAA